MCPDWESKQRHFGSQAGAPSSEPHTSQSILGLLNLQPFPNLLCALFLEGTGSFALYNFSHLGFGQRQLCGATRDILPRPGIPYKLGIRSDSDSFRQQLLTWRCWPLLEHHCTINNGPTQGVQVLISLLESFQSTFHLLTL